MAMNKQRKSSNLINILSYDDAGNIVLRDYSQTIRYNWNGTIHAFTGPLSVSSVAAAVTDTDRFLVSDGGVLKYRTGAEVLSDIGAIGGSGTAGQVAYWNGTGSQTGSANLTWDNTNVRFGIGATPGSGDMLRVGGNTFSNTLTTNGGIFLNRAGDDAYILFQRDGNTTAQLRAINGGGVRVLAANASEWARFFSTGNLGINTGSTDTGQRLQVQGDAFIKGSGATSGTNALTVQNSDGNNILRLRNDLAALFNFVGTSLTMSGEANYTIMLANQAFYFRSNGGTAGRAFKIFDNASSLTGTSGANQNIQSLITFAPTSGTATYTDLDLSSTINQTGGANGITRGLYVRPTLTAAADWRSIEWSNNSGWGLYGAGTANNYLAGSLGIGTTILTGVNLYVVKAISGSTISTGIYQSGTVQSGVTSFAFGFNNTAILAASTTLGNYYHYSTDQSSFGAGATLTNQVGFFASGAMTSATNNYGFRGGLTNGTGRWNLYMDGTADNYLAGKLLIGTTTVSTFALDVNGTARVSGASSFGDNATISKNYNGETKLTISNTTTGDSSVTYISLVSSNGLLNIGKRSSTVGVYKFLAVNDSQIFNNTSGDIAILNDFSSGAIKFAAGGSSTAHMTLASNGNLLVGTTADQGYRVQITGSGDNMLNVWGATAPSIRLDNAASGATQRFVIGLATATNNFIQGANAGDVCMTPGTSSALVFGMWQTSSSSEVMRISTSSNVLIGKNTDSGQKLQVVGKVNLTSLPTSATGLAAGDIWNNGGVLNIV